MRSSRHIFAQKNKGKRGEFQFNCFCKLFTLSIRSIRSYCDPQGFFSTKFGLSGHFMHCFDANSTFIDIHVRKRHSRSSTEVTSPLAFNRCKLSWTCPAESLEKGNAGSRKENEELRDMLNLARTSRGFCKMVLKIQKRTLINDDQIYTDKQSSIIFIHCNLISPRSKKVVCIF